VRFFRSLGVRRCTHAHPGEICNFAAYAFVEAIVVVRPFLVFKAVARKPYSRTDPHGRIICRDIRYSVPRRPQRETVSLWMDRVYSMYPRGVHPSSERSRRTERYEYRGFQEVVPLTWVPVLGVGCDCIFYCFGRLGSSEVWTQVHVTAHRGLQFDRWSQCQLYPRSRCLYPYLYQG